jgi:hypothetical protein
MILMGGPSTSYGLGELDALHRAQHVGVGRLDDFEAGFLDRVDHVHANEGLVLDDEDHLLSRCFFHGLNLVSAELSSFKKGGF